MTRRLPFRLRAGLALALLLVVCQGLQALHIHVSSPASARTAGAVCVESVVESSPDHATPCALCWSLRASQAHLAPVESSAPLVLVSTSMAMPATGAPSHRPCLAGPPRAPPAC